MAAEQSQEAREVFDLENPFDKLDAPERPLERPFHIKGKTDYPLVLEHDSSRSGEQGTHYRVSEDSEEDYGVEEISVDADGLAVNEILVHPGIRQVQLRFDDEELAEDPREYRFREEKDGDIRLLAEVGYSKREIAQLKYDRETEELKGRRNEYENWKNYHGGQETDRIKLMDRVFAELAEDNSSEELYSFYYAGDLEKEMKKFDIGPKEYISKVEDVQSNLKLSGVGATEAFDSLACPSNNILKLDMGTKEAIFIDAESLISKRERIDNLAIEQEINDFDVPENLINDDNAILGLGVFDKKRFQRMFESKTVEGLYFAVQQIYNNEIHRLEI